MLDRLRSRYRELKHPAIIGFLRSKRRVHFRHIDIEWRRLTGRRTLKRGVAQLDPCPQSSPELHGIALTHDVLPGSPLRT
jgi:hypothetical protein